MIIRDITETIYEYENGNLTRKVVTETHEEDDTTFTYPLPECESTRILNQINQMK